VYVGQTGRPNPILRWADRVGQLSTGASPSKLLQAAWDEYPDLKCWQFRVLDRVDGKREANHREAEFILKTAEAARLNTGNTSTVSLGRRRQVETMLDKGCKYVEIRDTVGVSMGTISKIKKAREQLCAA
jgi:hypothetical protein